MVLLNIFIFTNIFIRLNCTHDKTKKYKMTWFLKKNWHDIVKNLVLKKILDNFSIDFHFSGTNYNTVDSRKTPKNKRYIRKSSVGPSGSGSSPSKWLNIYTFNIEKLAYLKKRLIFQVLCMQMLVCVMQKRLMWCSIAVTVQA